MQDDGGADNGPHSHLLVVTLSHISNPNHIIPVVLETHTIPTGLCRFVFICEHEGWRCQMRSKREMWIVSPSSSPSPKRSRKRKKLTIFRKAMTSKKISGWSSKGWQANAGWQPGPLSLEAIKVHKSREPLGNSRRTSNAGKQR